MNEPKICCNCLHCARWQTSKGIETHCDLTDKYLGYLQVMNEYNNCEHWEKETKWDLQKKHDADLLERVADMVLSLPKKYIDNFDYVACALILNGLEELKAEVSK